VALDDDEVADRFCLVVGDEFLEAVDEVLMSHIKMSEDCGHYEPSGFKGVYTHGSIRPVSFGRRSWRREEGSNESVAFKFQTIEAFASAYNIP